MFGKSYGKDRKPWRFENKRSEMSGLVAIGTAKLLPLLARLSVVGVVMYFVTSRLLKKRRRRRKMDFEDDSRALDALWGRYEHGEISWDEYEEGSRDLKEG